MRLRRQRKPGGPVQVLRDARDLISDRDHWVKHTPQDGRAYCAIGAVHRASGSKTPISELEHGRGHQYAGDDYQAVRYLQNAMPPTYRFVPGFNDAPSTTHADILKLFDKAICEAEQAEANGA